MKIGVFDSGMGGQAVAERLQSLLPNATVLSVDDRRNVPYGNRDDNEIIRLTDAAIQPLIKARCDAIVIACNTATTVAITWLRQHYPSQHFVGIEPMVKPAAMQTSTKSIAVLATPATLASQRYRELKHAWAEGVTVIEPNCTNWARLIEDKKAASVPIEATIESAIEQGADVIVLACTHYHWLKDRAESVAAGRATILEPSDAIKNRLTEILR